MTTKNKEQVYDDEISPLMAQILGICQQRGIAMIAEFAIPTEADPDLMCLSMLPDQDGKHPDTHNMALHILKGNAAPQAFAFTITTPKA